MKGQLFSMDFVVSVGILGVILAVTMHAAHFSQVYSNPSDKTFAVSEALMLGKLSALALDPSEYGYRYSTPPIIASNVVLESNFDLVCEHGRNSISRIGRCPAAGNICIIEVRVCA